VVCDLGSGCARDTAHHLDDPRAGIEKATEAQAVGCGQFATRRIHRSFCKLVDRWLAILTGIDTEGLWHVRAVGGALSFPLAFILLNNLRGAIIERNENIAKLSEVENELLGYRDSAKQVLLDANESMRAKTVAQVSPALENIDRLLQGRTEDKTRLDLIDELRNVIRDQIRPISRSLQETAEKLSMPERQLVEKPTAGSAFSSSFNLRRSLKLMPAMLLLVLGFPMVAFLVIDSKSMFRGLLGALAFAAVMAILRLLVPKNKEFKTAAGLALLTVLVAISVLPGFLITYFRYGLTGEVITNGFWMLGIALGAFGLTAYARGLDALQAKFAVELEQFNDKFTKEVALFEQKLWLERRAWSYIIHGDVQGALSAALTRLQRSDKLEPFEIEMVKQDLQRAKVALTKPASREIDLVQASTNWFALGRAFVTSTLSQAREQPEQSTATATFETASTKFAKKQSATLFVTAMQRTPGSTSTANKTTLSNSKFATTATHSCATNQTAWVFR
jgi:hypothetical protein